MLLSLPFKKGDLVKTDYTKPPSTRKIEELEISSVASSGVRVKLEGVKEDGVKLWLDSSWIEPIKLLPTLPFVGEVVSYVGGKEYLQLEVKEVLTDLTPPMIRLAGITKLVDPEWVSPIRHLFYYLSPYGEQPLPYKAGDKVTFFQNNTPHYPQELVVERIFPTLQGVRVKFVGVDEPGYPKWISPYKQERALAPAPATEPKAKLNIKWIPVDPENLPKGEVLAMRNSLWLIGKLEKIDYSLGSTKVTTDENTYLYNTDENTYLYNPVAYIPLNDLKQLWEEQNPAPPTPNYSQESEAFKLIEWVIKSDSSIGKALKEIPVEANHTIKILAEEIINKSWLEENAPKSPSRASYKFFSFRKELIDCIKFYIAN